MKTDAQLLKKYRRDVKALAQLKLPDELDRPARLRLMAQYLSDLDALHDPGQAFDEGMTPERFQAIFAGLSPAEKKAEQEKLRRYVPLNLTAVERKELALIVERIDRWLLFDENARYVLAWRPGRRRAE